MNYFIEFIDDSRLKCDELIQTAVSLKTTAETTLAWRSLQMGKAWLGKVKLAFGEKPYTVAENAKDIPPTAEKYVGEVNLTNDKLANLNSIRERIETITDSFEPYVKHLTERDLGKKEIDYALKHLAEAKMWYGFELSNMRDLANQENN
jgi:hypothetical protein